MMTSSLTDRQAQPISEAASPEQYVVQWEDYKVTILTMALKIHASGWVPDSIICIGRGGMLVGDALSRIFKTTVGVVMCSSYRGEGEKKQGILKIAEHISITKRELGAKVLLADDLVDSGSTLHALSAILKEKYPEVVDLKTTVIYQKSGSQ